MRPSEVPPPGRGARARRTAARWLMGLLVLLLAAAVVVGVGQLNARTFTLRAEGGRLVVMKGRALPFLEAPYRPSEPAQARAYAPLPLAPEEAPELLTQRFTSREALDRGLFAALERAARARLTSPDPARQAQGLPLLERAEALPSLGEPERRTLEALRAEAALQRARTHVGAAQRELVEALEQARRAVEARSAHAEAAQALIPHLQAALVALDASQRPAPAAPAPPAPAPDAGTPGP